MPMDPLWLNVQKFSDICGRDDPDVAWKFKRIHQVQFHRRCPFLKLETRVAQRPEQGHGEGDNPARRKVLFFQHMTRDP